MWGRAVEAGRFTPRKIPLELRGIILPEPRRHQRSRHCRTDSLAGAGLGEYDVPEVDIRIDEGHAHESSFSLLRKEVTTQSTDLAVCSLRTLTVWPGIKGVSMSTRAPWALTMYVEALRSIVSPSGKRQRTVRGT